MSKKPLSHQQKRWNRHYNYRLEADFIALTIFNSARGKLTPKESLAIAENVRAELLGAAASLLAAAPPLDSAEVLREWRKTIIQ